MLVSVSVGGCFIYPVAENLFCHESGEMKIIFFTNNFIRARMGHEFTTEIYMAD
jgi:hypothetical protein